MELTDLGLDDWFKKHLAEPLRPDHGLARVVAADKEKYRIRNELTEIPAEIAGKILFTAESNLDFPAVGDWVMVQYVDNGSFAIIHEILPRRSVLKRKMAGKKIGYQLIAANIDIAFITQSFDLDFNLPRLERYLTMVNESHIESVILLSKSDLVPPEQVEQKVREIKSANSDYQIIAFSNKTGQGLDEIRRTLAAGKTACLLGSSGVGKTTLLNKLIGEEIFATGAVRQKDGKGRHITARRQLIILARGGMIIDTPGMRELGNIGVDMGLQETFKDISELSQKCRFKDCTHTSEPGCMVLEAVEKGLLSSKRHQNYLKLRKESQYYELSYLERRKRNKHLGKFYKQAKKSLKVKRNGKV